MRFLLALAASTAVAAISGWAGSQAGACHLMLEAAKPTGVCAVPAGGPLLADVPVRGAANPKGAPVEVRITFTSPSGETVKLEPVSLYPVDRPATFRVRLPSPSAKGQLAFDLKPNADGQKIEVGPVTWLYREP